MVLGAKGSGIPGRKHPADARIEARSTCANSVGLRKSAACIDRQTAAACTECCRPGGSSQTTTAQQPVRSLRRWIGLLRGRKQPPGGDRPGAASARCAGAHPALCGSAVTRVADRLWTTSDASDWSRFRSEREVLPPIRPRPMFASPRAFILHHRERLAVLVSSALFLTGALPLVWAIG